MPVHMRQPVVIHVYDLKAQAQPMNAVLRKLGTGVFHCGVEVYGREWSYGGVSREGTGVFWNPPKGCMCHAYRESVQMGKTTLSKNEVERLLCVLKAQWAAEGYDILKHNCCHFSDELCKRLGVGSVPAWVMSLACTGAAIAADLGLQQNERKVANKSWPFIGLPGRGGYEQLGGVGHGDDTAAKSWCSPRPWICCLSLVAIIAVAGTTFYGLSLIQRFGTPGSPAPATGTQRPLLRQSVPYDCKEGFYNWEQDWSNWKKAWCCEHEGRGCSSPSTSARLYNCRSETTEAEEEWPAWKREWCCKHEGAGCLRTTSGPVWTASAGATSSSQAPAPTPVVEPGALPYNCSAGGGPSEWTVPKQSWCCHLEGVGCSTGTQEPAKPAIPIASTHTLPPALPTSVPYNCSGKSSEAWSSEKRSWCCQIQGRGCPIASNTFTDFCESGDTREWTRFKLAWCCRHKGRGCEVRSIKDRSDHAASGDSDQRSNRSNHSDKDSDLPFFSQGNTTEIAHHASIVKLG